MADDIVVPVRADVDVLIARQKARGLAATLKFANSEATLIATAIFEVARNIVLYAGSGEVVLRLVQKGRRRGLCVIARDRGPEGDPRLSIAQQTLSACGSGACIARAA